MQKVLLLIVFVTFYTSSYCQKSYYAIDVAVMDLKIRTKNTRKISQKITSGFTTDEQKIRAIYSWIAWHIDYDWDLYRDRIAQRKLATKKVKRQLRITLRKRKAICGGYAQLLKVLAHEAGIDCEEISGYSKTKAMDIGRKKRPDHAWNMVRIDGEWQLLDVTWGQNFRSMNFDPFFFSDPVKFNYSHLPLEDQRTLNTMGITRDVFINLPVVEQGFYSNGFSLHEYSTNGIIEVKTDEPFQVWFERDEAATFAKFTSGKQTYNAKVSKEDGLYKVTYAFEKKGNYYATLHIDGIPTLTYLVKVKPAPREKYQP